MEVTRLNVDVCPWCRGELNACSSVNGDVKPRVGDLSLCFHCGEINQFSKEMKLIQFPPVLFSGLPKKLQKELLQAQSFIKKKS